MTASVSISLAAQPGRHVFVEAGRALAVQIEGQEWEIDSGAMVSRGAESILFGARRLGPTGKVRLRISLDELSGSHCGVVVGDADLLLDDLEHNLAVVGRMFGPHRVIGPNADRIEPGKPFTVEIIRAGDGLRVTLDGDVLVEREGVAQQRLSVGLKSGHGFVRLHDFVLEGESGPRSVREAAPHVAVFESGSEGYHTFRIPSIVGTPTGALLAFCEGRRDGGRDRGDIDVVMRRSDDGGQSWSDLRVLWDDGPNNCGSPCAVVDSESGAIHLLMCHSAGQDAPWQLIRKRAAGSRTVWITRSEDDGRSWTAPVDLTASTKLPEWGWVGTGSGAGIRLEHGPHAGRLVVPCHHSNARGIYRSHVIYSDDKGQTWQLGGSVPVPNVGECEVVEMPDAHLVLNMRSYDAAVDTRLVSVSSDSGSTWAKPTPGDHVDPCCHASVRRIAWSRDGSPDVVAFSNLDSMRVRQNLTLRVSFSDGIKKWTGQKTLYPGSSAYSCLVALPDGAIGVLYEIDEYQRIVFTRVAREDLEEN